ncbi:berberine bridge enzyme-like 13 [Glycine max]|uniref:berberine bridge enzyme-like 13 n=1 Tax=Glycine max TaxID=3847 RepID=UPI0003DE8E5F|nr:berberine bridge enzyme-like 13 [Glycine max]
MLFIQFVYAGMGLLSKAAISKGMSPYVFVVYRQAFASVALSPFAFFDSKKSAPLSCNLLCKLFLVSLVGYDMSLSNYTCTMQNKEDALQTETELLSTFDYAWNTRSNCVRRPDDILQKLHQIASCTRTLSDIARVVLPFTQKCHPRLVQDITGAIQEQENGKICGHTVTASFETTLSNCDCFTVTKTLEQGGSKLLHRWQQVAPQIDENLFIRVIIQPGNGTVPGKRTVTTSYNALFLGGANRLLQVMKHGFPELGLTRKDCVETSWIKSVLYIAGYPDGTTPEVLLQGKSTTKAYFKAKSNFVREVITEKSLNALWKIFLQDDGPLMIWNSYGGKMSRIAESASPFPHRKGVLYKIQHVTGWLDGEKSMAKHTNWMRKFYFYMAPYVSKYPRETYVNYTDLDIGMNQKNNTSLLEASSWGYRYFKGNFNRLVKVKTKVDPSNFFRHEQSIPLLPTGKKE